MSTIEPEKAEALNLRPDPTSQEEHSIVRNMKVQYYCTDRRKNAVPKILLQGKWLREAGFSINDPICIIVKDKCLLIRPAEEIPDVKKD